MSQSTITTFLWKQGTPSFKDSVFEGLASLYHDSVNKKNEEEEAPPEGEDPKDAFDIAHWSVQKRRVVKDKITIKGIVNIHKAKYIELYRIRKKGFLRRLFRMKDPKNKRLKRVSVDSDGRFFLKAKFRRK